MLKRSREVYETPALPSPQGSPAKRPHIQPVGSSPLVGRGYSKFYGTPCSRSTPRTPHTVPLDSPSNPFGVKRSLVALELPSAIPLRKHFVLRFQLVCEQGGPSYRRQRGGVYRVVQVPRNYTFRHLHKLILFLFASDADDDLPPPSKDYRASSKGKEKATSSTQSTWHGHVFEVQKRVKLHRYHTQAGVIQAGGQTFAKLSSVRERRLFRDLYDPSPPDGFSVNLDDSEAEDDPEGWTWVCEDDFTLSQAWPKSLATDRGIIYRHSRNISVHITPNTLEVDPPRKSSSSSPYVHLAQGSAGNAIKLAHMTLDENGDEQVPGDSDVISLEPSAKVNIARWNFHRAFAAFLRREGDRERGILRRYLPEELLNDSTVVLPSSSPTLRPSSEAEDSEPDTEFTLSSSYFYTDPLPFPMVTPYPTHPLHRKRVERVERRMERLTKSGMSVLSSDDEESKKRKKSKKRKRPSEEVLEWSDDGVDGNDAEADENDAEVDENNAENDEEHGADWDPFGDEVEV
ncbi:unnamed protein product [Somion occarium]|uniref:Uncharacterized protein n=1 Tax=Somion occarium TaxID=3059160 RepID=A0ABP1DM94_9APHY